MNNYEIQFMDKEMGILGDIKFLAINLIEAMRAIVAGVEEWPAGTKSISITLLEN